MASPAATTTENRASDLVRQPQDTDVVEESKGSNSNITPNMQVSDGTNGRVMTEQSDKPLLDPDDYSPIVLVPTEQQKNCIDQVVLEIARVFKEKVIDLVEPLCEKCDIAEADQVLDSMKIAEVLGEIAVDRQDIDFLQKFAYTQTFSFLLEQYLVAQQQQDTELDTDRDSPEKPVQDRELNLDLGAIAIAKQDNIRIENMDTVGNDATPYASVDSVEKEGTKDPEHFSR